jgi:hypothetical protein
LTWISRAEAMQYEQLYPKKNSTTTLYFMSVNPRESPESVLSLKSFAMVFSVSAGITSSVFLQEENGPMDEMAVIITNIGMSSLGVIFLSWICVYDLFI